MFCYVVGLGNSRHFLNQSDLQLKSTASFACFYFEFSWAPRDIFLAMIGCRGCYGFTTQSKNVLKILTLSSFYLKMICYREHDGEYYGLCVQSVLPTCISNVDSIVIIDRSRKMVVFELRSRRRKNLYVLSKGGGKSKILSLHEESNLIFSDFALRCSSTKPQRLHGMKGYYRGTYALHEYNHKRTMNS